MKPDRLSWNNSLQEYIILCRQERPVPVRLFLPVTQKLQARIIKDRLLSQLEGNISAALYPAGRQQNEAQAIIFTSNRVGLAAAREVQRENDIDFYYLHPHELRDFLRLYPDPEYRNHIHLWSHIIEAPDSQTMVQAQHYQLQDHGCYWLHVEGLICGPRLARGMEHLWTWDGVRPKLLKKNFRHWAA